MTGSFRIRALVSSSRPRSPLRLTRLPMTECLTHVGDSQAVRSLLNVVPMTAVRQARLSPYGTDFDSVSHCGAFAKRTRDRPRAVVCWRWPRSTMVPRTDASRIGGVGLPGCATPALHRAHPRSSTPITAAHWRRLLRPARSRRSTASWRRKDLARWLTPPSRSGQSHP